MIEKRILLDHFMDSYFAETNGTPIKRYREWDGIARFWIVKGRASITLRRLSVPSTLQGQGFGGSALDWICELADVHGVEITGYARNFGYKGLTCAQLKSWYRRHGFKISRDGTMRREPKGSKNTFDSIKVVK